MRLSAKPAALAALALSSAALGGLPAWAQPDAGQAAETPTVIPVELNEFHYSPSSIELAAGHSYTLRVTNSGGVAHDLNAKAFFQSVTFAPGSAAKVRDGDIETAKGQTVDVTFVTGKAGAYDMRCTHPLHAMFGMKGRIVVR